MVARVETQLYVRGADSLNLLKSKDGFFSTEVLSLDTAAEVLRSVDVVGSLFKRDKLWGYTFQSKDGKEFTLVFTDQKRLDPKGIIRKVEEQTEEVGLTVVLN